MTPKKTTVRQNLYWHIFIQWLASNDILEEYTDSWIDTTTTQWLFYGSNDLMEYKGLIPSPDGRSIMQVFRNLPEEYRFGINAEAKIRHQSNATNYAKRYYPTYTHTRLLKEGNRFHGTTWSHICNKFASECFYNCRNQRLRRTALSTIKRAWGTTGATLPS